MRNLILALALACSFPALVAEEASDPAAIQLLPEGPLLNRAPESGQWTVTFKAGGGGKDGAPRPDAVDFQTVITKAKTIYHIETMTGAGMKQDKWHFDGVQVTITPNSEYPVVSTLREKDAYYVDLSRTDFPEVEWISPRNFVEVKNIGGVDCVIFKDRIANSFGQTSECQAVIDLKTRLPVSLLSDGGLMTFQFRSSPSGDIRPPQTVVALADHWIRRQRQASLLPPP